MLPKLKKSLNTKKKYYYKLEYPAKTRRLAINEGINYENKKMGKSLKKAATAKKGRLNILRIYRRYRKIDECNKITRDMRYIDKKYKLGKTKNICGTKSKKGGKKNKKNKTKKKFLYNPNNPKKSFDVYIDKNPNDTIPIKYTTLEDVKNTINKLEKLYKSDKYPHKRIWQVGMIMYVRLKVLKDKKPKEFKLSQKYFKFLGKRTKLKDEKSRKKLHFKF